MRNRLQDEKQNINHRNTPKAATKGATFAQALIDPHEERFPKLPIHSCGVGYKTAVVVVVHIPLLFPEAMAASLGQARGDMGNYFEEDNLTCLANLLLKEGSPSVAENSPAANDERGV